MQTGFGVTGEGGKHEGKICWVQLFEKRTSSEETLSSSLSRDIGQTDLGC